MIILISANNNKKDLDKRATYSNFVLINGLF